MYIVNFKLERKQKYFVTDKIERKYFVISRKKFKLERIESIDSCPSGSDSDCSLGQSCYGVEVCNNNFCGVSLDDASQCNDNDACPSGSDSSCSFGQSCLEVNKCTPINCASTTSGIAKTTKSGKCKKSKGSKSGSKNHLCGVSLDDASLCNGNDAYPSGSDSDCSIGQSYY